VTDLTLRDLIDERHKAHYEEHRIHEKAHEREHAATEQAIKTATVSLDRRLDQMNEFRNALTEQAATFVRRETLDAFITERRHALEVVGDEMDKRYDELRQLIGTEREERRANEGVKRGMSQTTGIIVGAIGVAATLISILVIFANFATGTP